MNISTFVNHFGRKFAFNAIAALFAIPALALVLYFVLLLVNGHWGWAFFIVLPVIFILGGIADWAAKVAGGTKEERDQLDTARKSFREKHPLLSFKLW